MMLGLVGPTGISCNSSRGSVESESELFAEEVGLENTVRAYTKHCIKALHSNHMKHFTEQSK